MKKILLGNEAIVRGALEAGVNFVSTYPGTPASEIGNTFYKIAKEAGVYPHTKRGQGAKIDEVSPRSGVGVYFEFSTNEKVALEAGIGASFSGLKTLVAMKHFGLNVASDSLMPFCYTGSKGPTVIVVADDPNCWSSAQSEQNSRAYSYLAHIPTLEPSDPQECKDFIKLAFEISEKFNLPILIRLTTRVSHQRAPVKLGKLSGSHPDKARFVKEPQRFVTMPPRVLEMKKELFKKIEKIKEFSEKTFINKISLLTSDVNKQKTGIITSGVSYLYVMEALEELKIDLPVLKLGFFYPLSEKKIKDFIKNLKKVLTVEELEPYLEKEITALAKSVNPGLQIYGKALLPEVGELKPDHVVAALATVLKTHDRRVLAQRADLPKFPKRLPNLCPGCPYWLVFGAAKKAVDFKKVIFGGDIGCYMLAGLPPHNIQDYLSCMGSSIGIAHGIKKATAGQQKLIAFIGDSTFFHAGIPALINTVFNKSNPLIIVMDNQTMAMTGHQPHPGAPAKPDGIKIENIVKACGVKNLKVIDPIKQKELIKTIKEFLNKKQVSVIIARRPCIFVK